VRVAVFVSVLTEVEVVVTEALSGKSHPSFFSWSLKQKP
jgi:hypothetical protein